MLLRYLLYWLIIPVFLFVVTTNVILTITGQNYFIFYKTLYYLEYKDLAYSDLNENNRPLLSAYNYQVSWEDGNFCLNSLKESHQSSDFSQRSDFVLNTQLGVCARYEELKPGLFGPRFRLKEFVINEPFNQKFPHLNFQSESIYEVSAINPELKTILLILEEGYPILKDKAILWDVGFDVSANR